MEDPHRYGPSLPEVPAVGAMDAKYSHIAGAPLVTMRNEWYSF